MKENKLNVPLESIIAHLPGHVYWLDRNNIFLGSNDLQAKAAGFKNRHEIVGKSNYEMPWRHHADALNAVNNKVMSTGQEHSVEEILITVEGKEFIFLSKKVPLFDDESNIVGILGISFDITEQKEHNKKLLEAKEQADITLENIMDHLPGHIYWLDRNNVFLGCNAIQAKSAGVKNRSEMVGKTNYDMPWRDQADAFNRVNNKVMTTGQEYSVEEIARQANGAEIVFLAKKVPLLDPKGNIIGILGISVDITQQKEAEKKLIEEKERAEAANRAKTEFLENMRHDIRTPLSGIAGFAELIKNETDLNKLKHYFNQLVASSSELLRYLNEVLDAFNVASGAIPMLKKKFSFKTIIENVIKLHQTKANEKKLQLTHYVDSRIPAYLMGDHVRIYRIMLELIANALKFTEQGGISISASLAKKDGRDIVVRLEIADTGLGIPPEKQQGLFVTFKRLTPSYQGIYKGAGLGLSIVKQFVDDLHGEVYIESESDKGAKFICLFPLKESLLNDDYGEDIYIPQA
ncbi:MAG TPA: PAS domain-containing sensor histidine kinase [Gammaproteobacteria bacterium]|nr:PAS domain-containing sensor histidine kinase [Gammaproteobacteria bacterium]